MAKNAISRCRRNLIAVVCALAAIVVCALDHSCTSQSRNRPAQSTESHSSADIQKYHGRQFTVIKVIDGDTLDIDIPDGNYPHTRIRLWGVDTPETKDPRTDIMYYGPEASAFTKKIAMGKKVTIFLDKNNKTRDNKKYNRLLAYVQLPDKTFLNEKLLSEGYAYADWRFKHAFFNKYKQLESIARSQSRGLWADITPEQMPKWRQKRESPGLETAEVNN
jgi:micrococcal nuclease